MSSDLPRQTGYGVGAPSIKLNPPPIISNRSPTTTDIRYPLMQEWLNKNTKTAYQLVSVEAGVAQWNVSSDDASSFPITPYVVGPVGQAGYQTVQAAINAANAAGGGAIYVQPGTYTENLTLFDKISITGTNPLTCIITGVHTPPASGSVIFQDITLTTATHIFSSVAAGTTSLFLLNCICTVTNGFVFNLANWTGSLEMLEVTSDGTNNGVVNNSAGAPLVFANVTGGVGTGQTMVTSGVCDFEECDFNCPINFTTGSIIQVEYTLFNKTVTLSNNSSGYFNFCTFSTGSTAALTMSSSAAVSLSECVITSSNNPAIAGAGAGALTLTGISFTSNVNIAGTLTVLAGEIRGGNFISQFVVGSAPDAHYQTVQAAINAANAAGGGAIYVQPGTYTENLTLFDKISITGTNPLTCIITGVHTPPASGSLIFQDITLTTATHIFSSVAAGTTSLFLLNCICTVTNGFIFNLANWTGALQMFEISSDGTNNGVVNNSAGAPLVFANVTAGVGTGQTMVTSGVCDFEECNFGCPINHTTGTVLEVEYCQFNRTVTLSNNSSGYFNFCTFSTGSTAALTMSSSGAISIVSSNINSSNNPAITGAGAGTLTLGDVTFISNALIAATLTVAYASMIGVTSTTNTPGASPQVVNARTGQVKFTDTIANGAYGTLTLTNSIITASSVVIGVASCTTANSALQIVEITPTSGSVAFRIYNAGSATTAANILINFWILN